MNKQDFGITRSQCTNIGTGLPQTSYIGRVQGGRYFFGMIRVAAPCRCHVIWLSVMNATAAALMTSVVAVSVFR